MARTNFSDWNFMGDALGDVKSYSRKPFNPAVSSFIFLFASFVLLLTGTVCVYSAAIGLVNKDPSTYFFKQILFALLGVVAGVLIVSVPIDIVKKSSPVVALCAILYYGYEVISGSSFFSETSYIIIFAATALYFTSFFANRNNDVNSLKDIAAPMIFSVLMAVIILASGDLIKTFLFTLYAISLFMIGGVGLAGTLLMILFVLIPTGCLIFSSPSKINSLIGYIIPGFSGNYQASQAVLRRQCIASGSIYGKGLAMGQFKFSELENITGQNIICNLCEECGLMGFICIMVLFIVIAVTAYLNSSKIKFYDIYRSNLINSLITFVVFCAVFNLLTVFGYFPENNISLPLISFGVQTVVQCCLIALIYKGMLDDSHKTKKGELAIARGYDAEEN